MCQPQTLLVKHRTHLCRQARQHVNQTPVSQAVHIRCQVAGVRPDRSAKTCSCAALQLRNFAVPASLEGVSLGTVLLATTGNALMVPRALITDDLVWFAGYARTLGLPSQYRLRS